MAVSASLLLSWLPMLPGMAEAKRDDPDPEKVYRQLRREPVIRTRDEALEYLGRASPGDLWKSAKFSVDARIRDVLAYEKFESLDEEIREKLHANMLEVRSAFWTEDLAKLSAAEEGLRELCAGGKIASAVGDRGEGEPVQDRVCGLVEEIELALSLQKCMRAREKQRWGDADSLECLLRGGPED